MIIRHYMTTEFGDFLQLEPLTLCPIDKTPIDVAMLTEEEKEWLNNYHREVFERLSPFLEGEDLEWLKDACSAL